MSISFIFTWLVMKFFVEKCFKTQFLVQFTAPFSVQVFHNKAVLKKKVLFFLAINYSYKISAYPAKSCKHLLKGLESSIS
jgi:hypothetical protein